MNTSPQVNLSTSTKLHNLRVALREVMKQLSQEGKPKAEAVAGVALECLGDAEAYARQGR